MRGHILNEIKRTVVLFKVDDFEVNQRKIAFNASDVDFKIGEDFENDIPSLISQSITISNNNSVKDTLNRFRKKI